MGKFIKIRNQKAVHCVSLIRHGWAPKKKAKVLAFEGRQIKK